MSMGWDLDSCALAISKVAKIFYKPDRKKMSEDGAGWKRLVRKVSPPKKRISVVEDVDFCVPRGAIYGVLGPNGSGKSTLVRMIATLLLPDCGNISVFGHDVVKDPLAVKRLINRVSVDAAFFRKLSALENLVYAGRLYGLNPDEAIRRAKEILKKLGFDSSRLASSMSDLSRGMQQKVAIARGFMTSPILLLLDEPTTGLDPKSKREVQTFIKQLRTEHDTTILLTTHDMAEAEALCDKIAVLKKGKIVAFDTAEGLKQMFKEDGSTPTLEEVFIKLVGEETEEEGSS
jgi:ABC-2 type transport system ATP-binding protein